MGYTIIEFTGEYKRKHMPNIRSLGGIYYSINIYEQYQSFDYTQWEGWNCQRCKHDVLINKEQTLCILQKNKKSDSCNIQGDLLLNMFEGKPIPNQTHQCLGMNRYGVGTCAEFEECEENGS